RVRVPPPASSEPRRRDRRRPYLAHCGRAVLLAGTRTVVRARRRAHGLRGARASAPDSRGERVRSALSGDWCIGNTAVLKTATRGSAPRSPARFGLLANARDLLCRAEFGPPAYPSRIRIGLSTSALAERFRSDAAVSKTVSGRFAPTRVPL